MSYLPPKPDSVFSTVNVTTSALGIGGTYTGTYESNDYVDLLVSVVADVDLDYWVDLSSDGVTADVSVPYEVRGGGINYPHRLTVGPRYVRLRIENNSGTAATFTKGNLQFGSFNDLTIGQHRIAAQDNDATIVRPTDFRIETAVGLRDGFASVQKLGVNEDVDTGANEVLASFGGTFTPVTAAQTFTITYTNTLDGSTSSGATQLLIDYLDANNELAQAVHVLGSGGSDVTAFTGLGINRVIILATGGDDTNGGDITVTATTDATNQAQVPAGLSTTQQLIYHTPVGKSFFLDQIEINANKLVGGSAPKVEYNLWSYSRVTGVKYRVDHGEIDTAISNALSHDLRNPMKFGGREVIYVEVSTDTNNTNIHGRFNGILQKD